MFGLSNLIGITGGNLTQGLFSSSGFLSGVNDTWGSFTGTSASVFLEAGQKSVKQAEQNLQQNLNSDPSGSLTEFSRFLNDELARFTNALSNSSQGKTRKGNQKSISDVKKAVDNIPNLVSKLKSSYSITSIKKQGSRTDFGKYTTPYTFSQFSLSSKNNQKSVNIKDVPFSSQNPNDSASNEEKSSFLTIGLGILAVLVLTKKIKL
jgi:hypothetical protein